VITQPFDEPWLPAVGREAITAGRGLRTHEIERLIMRAMVATTP
jgi:hypothetical protein